MSSSDRKTNRNPYESKKNKKAKNKTAQTIGFMLVFSIVVISVYYYVSTRTTPIFTEPVTNKTELEALLTKDLIDGYPSSPREVLKLYNRITKVYYSENLEDKEINQLADQMLLLLDDELKNNKTYEDYLLDLKVEITDYRNAKRIIMNDAIEPSNATIYWEDKDQEYASLSSSYTIKEGGDYTKVIEDFILRKDSEGKWKILGWQLSDKTELDAAE